MKTKRPVRGLLRRLGYATVVGGMVLAVAGLSANPASADKPDPAPVGKITICHRDNNELQPYGPKPITVDYSGANGKIQGPDHTGHDGPVFQPGMKADHAKWGDIIPPYEWDGGSFPGLNWDEGEAIWDNQCQIPSDECPDAEQAPQPAAAVTDVLEDDPCQPPCDPQTDENGCEEPCVPTVQNNECQPPCDPQTDENGCEEPCVPTVQNNECQPPCVDDRETSANECAPPPPPPPPPFDQCPLIPGNQPQGTDCTPPPPVDQCPDDAGTQISADQCTVAEVLPEVVVPVVAPVVAPVTAPETEVEGAVITKTAPAELPRTGTDTQPLLEVGLGLILLGAGTLLFGRERTASI